MARAVEERPGHLLLLGLRCASFVGNLWVMDSLNGHDTDEDGFHDSEDCELCIEGTASVTCQCHCGKCCEKLLLEASLRDAEREPRIAAECKPYKDFDPEIAGYWLNDRDNGYACHFFDRATRLCTIYETRPLMCRVFNCDLERASEDLGRLLSDKKEAPRNEA